MYLIVGLGNPGRQYEATRHNMGFDVIDKLVEEYQIPQGGVKFNAMYGAGGHNGIKNIIQELGTQKFVRIKVGVGAKPQGWDLADYVLGRFGSEDRKLVDEAQDRACKAVELILSDGPDAAMNEFNKKPGVV